MAGMFSAIPRRLLEQAMLGRFNTPEDAAPQLPQTGVLSTMADLPDVQGFKPAKGPNLLQRVTRDDPETGDSFLDKLAMVGASLQDAGDPESRSNNVGALEQYQGLQRRDRAAREQKSKTDAFVASRNDPRLTEMYAVGGAPALAEYLKDEAGERRIRERPEFKTVGGDYGDVRNGQFNRQGAVSPTPGEVFNRENLEADNRREDTKAEAEAAQREWLRTHNDAELQARIAHDRAIERNQERQTSISGGNLALARERERREASTMTTDRVVARVLDKQFRGEELSPGDQAVLETYKGLRSRSGGGDDLEALLADMPAAPGAPVRPTANPRMAPAPAPRTAPRPANAPIAPARIQSQADFDRLPPGASFIDPATGRVGRKTR